MAAAAAAAEGITERRGEKRSGRSGKTGGCCIRRCENELWWLGLKASVSRPNQLSFLFPPTTFDELAALGPRR
jgi:hypothetical protein